MICRNVIFQLEVIKQRLPAGLVSHHEQASKRNREQQHRVLWPAYNPNLAARQASTEGLFQQTRLITPIGTDLIPDCSSYGKNPRPGSQRPTANENKGSAGAACCQDLLQLFRPVNNNPQTAAV